MINRFFATSLFCLCFVLSQALTIQSGKWYDFEGTLGKTNVTLSLYLTLEGQLHGNYCYNKYERKIQIMGTIKENKVELSELAGGKTTAHLKGIVATDGPDLFEGTWSDSAGTKSLEFKLKLSAVCGGTLKNRYDDFFYGTEQETENFMKQVKSSIQKNDKVWLAAHMRYPLKTSLDGTTDITINNKEQLIANFDRIFYPEYKERIKSACSCNLFNNYQGAMLGQGLIWMNHTAASNKKKYAYVIIALNNH